MKRKIFLLLLATFPCLYGCFPFGDDDVEDDVESFSNYEPIIMKRSDFESTTLFEPSPRIIVNSGKIYVKDNFIFVNEVNKGFHIIDNSNPTNPENIGFIQVFGSSDLSIKEDVFYVNNATDLLAFKIDESSQALEITKRLESIFPQIWSPEGTSYYNLEEDDIIIDWQLIN